MTDTLKDNPLTLMADLFMEACYQLKKPLMIAVHPAINDHDLDAGEASVLEDIDVRSSCLGLVVAIPCSAEQAKEIADLLVNYFEANL